MTRAFLIGPNPAPAAITRRLSRLFRVAVALAIGFGVVFVVAFILARIL